MSVSSPPDINYWFDKRCARAFWSQCELPPYRELLAHTIDWMAPRGHENWLDLGCGSGQLTRALWEKSAGGVASVVAVDCAAANDESLGQLRDELCPDQPERISFRQVDFSHGLPVFLDGTFDGIVSGLSIQYAQHYNAEKGCWTTEAYDRILAEAYRVLRPGGRFVFSVNVPDPGWFKVALRGIPTFFTARKPLKYFRNGLRMMRYGKWLKQEAARGRFHYLEKDVITDKLQSVGFACIEQRISYAGQAFLFRAYRPECKAAYRAAGTSTWLDFGAGAVTGQASVFTPQDRDPGGLNATLSQGGLNASITYDIGLFYRAVGTTAGITGSINGTFTGRSQ